MLLNTKDDFVFCNMYDKSTNFLKISSIFGEYFLPDSNSHPKNWILTLLNFGDRRQYNKPE